MPREEWRDFITDKDSDAPSINLKKQILSSARQINVKFGR